MCGTKKLLLNTITLRISPLLCYSYIFYARRNALKAKKKKRQEAKGDTDDGFVLCTRA
jgi:hypothetical protein